MISERPKMSKPVTVILLGPNCYTIPKNKKRQKKLRAEQIEFCSFLPTDTAEDVSDKIRSVFLSAVLTVADQKLFFSAYTYWIPI